MATQDVWEVAATDLVDIAYGVGALFAIGLFGWQVFQWLRYGVWQPYPFADAFTFFGIDLSSIYAPRSWFGFAKVIQWLLATPLCLTLPAILIAIAHAFQFLVRRRARRVDG